MNIETVMYDYARFYDDNNELVVVVKKSRSQIELAFNVFVPEMHRHGFRKCMADNSSWSDAMEDALVVFKIVMALRSIRPHSSAQETQ